MTGNLTTTGNVGIGITNPPRLLNIRGTNPTYLRRETSNNLAREITGIEFGIPAYGAASYARITSTTSANFPNYIQVLTSSGENTLSVKMAILGNGNVGIGIDHPDRRLYVNGTTFLNGNTTINGDTTGTGTGTGTSSIANGLNITGATNQAQSLFFYLTVII